MNAWSVCVYARHNFSIFPRIFFTMAAAVTDRRVACVYFLFPSFCWAPSLLYFFFRTNICGKNRQQPASIWHFLCTNSLITKDFVPFVRKTEFIKKTTLRLAREMEQKSKWESIRVLKACEGRKCRSESIMKIKNKFSFPHTKTRVPSVLFIYFYCCCCSPPAFPLTLFTYFFWFVATLPRAAAVLLIFVSLRFIAVASIRSNAIFIFRLCFVTLSDGKKLKWNERTRWRQLMRSGIQPNENKYKKMWLIYATTGNEYDK